jgi:hypothetical protein
MRFARVAAALLALLGNTALPRAADAAGAIVSFTKTSTGNIAFAVSDVDPPALAGSPAYGFSLSIVTVLAAGSVTLTAPRLTGAGGGVIAESAFSASCTATSDPGAIFSSAGIVRLASTPVKCADIAANATNTVKFDVMLYLDKMADSPAAFSADVYTNGTLTVTANAP